MTLSPSKTNGPRSLAAGATLGFQVACAIVYRSCSSSGSLSYFPSFWVQHPPGTLSRSLILHPDEAAVQGQVVSD